MRALHRAQHINKTQATLWCDGSGQTWGLPWCWGTGAGKQKFVEFTLVAKALNRGVGPAALAKDQLSIYKMLYLSDSFYGSRRFGKEGTFLSRPHFSPVEQCCDLWRALKQPSLVLKFFHLKKPGCSPFSCCMGKAFGILLNESN